MKKSGCSVRGFEIYDHLMTYDWTSIRGIMTEDTVLSMNDNAGNDYQNISGFNAVAESSSRQEMPGRQLDM